MERLTVLSFYRYKAWPKWKCRPQRTPCPPSMALCPPSHQVCVWERQRGFLVSAYSFSFSKRMTFNSAAAVWGFCYSVTETSRICFVKRRAFSSRTCSFKWRPVLVRLNVVVSAPPQDNMANPKEKTPMCLVNELARFNRIQPQYKLLNERGPAHAKVCCFGSSHHSKVNLILIIWL